MSEHDAAAQPQAEAVLRTDPVSHYHWLDFGGFPGQDTHALLKRAGWRWSRYREQYYTNRRWATAPEGITAEDGGTCDYSAERADRLADRTAKHQTTADAAYARSNAIADMIPLGQPIMVGHHSEAGHRRDLKRMRSLMDTTVQEAGTATALTSRAAASRRHQAHKQTLGQMARRADKLGAELRILERQEASWQGAHRAEWERRVGLLRDEIAELQSAIAEAGGLLADRTEVAVGDIIRIRGFVGTVVRINPKTYTVNVQNHWPLKLEKTWLQGIVQKAGEASA